MRLIALIILSYMSMLYAIDNPILFQPQTKEELQTAVDLWVTNENEALETYNVINKWDVSLITDMSGLFYDASYPYDFYDNFNSDISDWNVSSVTDMSNMFKYADNFNQNLSNWNVSNVTSMQYMFSAVNNSSILNGDISNSKVSGMSTMHNKLSSTEYFNQNWDASRVTVSAADKIVHKGSTHRIGEKNCSILKKVCKEYRDARTHTLFGNPSNTLKLGGSCEYVEWVSVYNFQKQQKHCQCKGVKIKKRHLRGDKSLNGIKLPPWKYVLGLSILILKNK